MSTRRGEAVSHWAALAGRVKCLAGRHGLEEVRQVAPDTVLAKCSRCGRHWAVKRIGDRAGVLIPWSSATEEFYDRLAKMREGTDSGREARSRAENSRQQPNNVLAED